MDFSIRVYGIYIFSWHKKEKIRSNIFLELWKRSRWGKRAGTNPFTRTWWIKIAKISTANLIGTSGPMHSVLAVWRPNRHISGPMRLQRHTERSFLWCGNLFNYQEHRTPYVCNLYHKAKLLFHPKRTVHTPFHLLNYLHMYLGIPLWGRQNPSG